MLLCTNDQGKSGRRQDLNQASPVLVFYTWLCIAGHALALPYCCYYMWVLYFAKFGDLKKNRKISICKNFCHHTRHPGVYTIKNCRVFSTLDHVKSFSFERFCLWIILSRAITSSRKWCLMISVVVGVSPLLCSHPRQAVRRPGTSQIKMYVFCHLFHPMHCPLLFTEPVDFKVELFTFRCVWIAKFSTCSNLVTSLSRKN